jgi:hypothetical protein
MQGMNLDLDILSYIIVSECKPVHVKYPTGLGRGQCTIAAGDLSLDSFGKPCRDDMQCLGAPRNKKQF